MNRNKRSVELNLKDPDDVADAHGQVLNVVIENFRPALDRLGLVTPIDGSSQVALFRLCVRADRRAPPGWI